jgi:hypothetical protein
MHGIIEGRGRADKNFTINPDTAYAICKEIEINRPDKAYFDIHKNCIHTIGHLILVQEGGDVDKSVNICNALTEDSKLHCLIAVFMENLQQQNLRVHDIRNSLIFDDTSKRKKLTVAENIQELLRKPAGKIYLGCLIRSMSLIKISSMRTAAMLRMS